MRRPNFILTILGMLILALGIFTCSILYWLVSNMIVIVAGFGAFLLFVYFLGSMYSYIKDTKIIQKNFDGERADELIMSLRKKTMASARKILILMLLYAFSWGVIIWFLKSWLL